MKNVTYRSLDQLIGDTEKRTPLSTRVRIETKSCLEKEAKARKLKVSALAAAILDDYASWLIQQGKK